jgi:uncharacterized iron-regulated membrane protein
MTLTATVMSYSWANDLLFRAMGSEPPSANRAPAPAPGGRGGSPGGPGRAERAVVQLTAEQLDRAWARADSLMPSWSEMTMRLPNREGVPVSFTITDGRSWNAFARSQLTVDAATGDIRQWQPYESNTLGQKARGWFRFAHTGELAGIPGQTIAGIACAGGVVLAWTGLSLALRRLFNWRLWRRLGAQRPVVLPTDPTDATTAVAD